MNLSRAGTFAKQPEEWDIVFSNGSHPSTGSFKVVIRHPETKKLVLFPLQFLDDEDFNFSKSIHKISSCPASESILPVGRLEKKFVARFF